MRIEKMKYSLWLVAMETSDCDSLRRGNGCLSRFVWRFGLEGVRCLFSERIGIVEMICTALPLSAPCIELS